MSHGGVLMAIVNVRMSQELRDALADATERNGTSLNTEVVRRLQESFDLTRPDPAEMAAELVAVIKAQDKLVDRLAKSKSPDEAVEAMWVSRRLFHLVTFLFGVRVLSKEEQE
jgi:hypothetical protein